MRSNAPLYAGAATPSGMVTSLHVPAATEPPDMNWSMFWLQTMLLGPL
jgi:hypothetical protein